MTTPYSAVHADADITHSIWRRTIRSAMIVSVLALPTQSMAFTLQLGDENTIQTPVAGDVQSFLFTINIDEPLAAGVYQNPPLVQIDYTVSGEPIVGSPSEFEAFALSRTIDGEDFYQTGNELVFEIADTAVLSDGVQAAELVGNAIILTFDAREVGTGRFHPARLELRADGTGRLQNSDNVPDIADPDGIPAGSEYITDIAFDAGNLTLVVANDEVQPDSEPVASPDGGAGQVDGGETETETDNTGTSSSDSSSGGTGIAFLLSLTLYLSGRMRFGGTWRRFTSGHPSREASQSSVNRK